MQTYKLSAYPELKRIVRAAEPSYSKQTVFVHVATKVSLFNQENISAMNDSSSVSNYTAVRLDTMDSNPAYVPPLGCVHTPEVEIPLGVAIVETGYFCGKKSTAQIWFHPENVTKALEHKGGEKKEERVLVKMPS